MHCSLYKKETSRNRKISALEKWGTGRAGGVSRTLLSTLLRVSLVKWIQTSDSNLKVSKQFKFIYSHKHS
jgi:hypothetical protein